jgi:membrane-bound lytic murein transglycosylase MltF
VLVPRSASAQQADRDRYDDVFRKYSKRFFGVGFDWEYFKAQGMAESGLDPSAVSRVGARGIMQLMPGTYALIKSRRADMGEIDDPEWNIAAGIMHSRGLWLRWNDSPDAGERVRFMFGSYNAGEGTILRARSVARLEQLDERAWQNIEAVAPKVQRWRYTETLPYVRKIENNHAKLKSQVRRSSVTKSKAKATQ